MKVNNDSVNVVFRHLDYRRARNVCGNNILRFTGGKIVCGRFNVCGLILMVHIYRFVVGVK